MVEAAVDSPAATAEAAMDSRAAMLEAAVDSPAAAGSTPMPAAASIGGAGSIVMAGSTTSSVTVAFSTMMSSLVMASMATATAIGCGVIPGPAMKPAWVTTDLRSLRDAVSLKANKQGPRSRGALAFYEFLLRLHVKFAAVQLRASPALPQRTAVQVAALRQETGLES